MPRAEILIAVPVLGRPASAAPLAESIRANTVTSHRLMFLCIDSDVDEIAACRNLGASVVEVPPRAGSWARKLNFAYAASAEPFILLAADDLRFHSGWDMAALELASEGYGVVGTNDLGNRSVMAGQHSTHPLVSRHYIDCCGTVDECGKILHEGYTHSWADVELVETAKRRGAFAFARDAVVEHLHPLWGKAVDDATYRLGQKEYRADTRLYHERRPLWEKIAA